MDVGFDLMLLYLISFRIFYVSDWRKLFDFIFFLIYTGFSRIWIDQGESRTMMASDLRSCEYHPDLIHRFQLHLRRSGS